MSDRSEVARGVNILVIDSGGASSLSSLLILDEGMSRLQRVLGLSQYPNVFEHFDVVAGTGTGAFIVCMVGRLRIPVDQAINYYQRLSEVFSKKRPLTGDLGAFRMRKLQGVMKTIVREVTGDENTKMVDTRPDAGKCRTVVFAMSQHNLNAAIPCVFRSYEGMVNQMADCAIWEVVCASMAHPEVFKSFDIGDGPIRQSFIGGTLGCGNPIEHALTEARALFPDRHVSSITSIGAGHTRTIQISQPGLLHGILPTNALIAMKDVATDCEAAAQRMAMRFQHAPNVYFRFSVEQGMQHMEMNDWERLNEVHAHTRAYTRLAAINGGLERAVKAIGQRKKTIKMAHIDGQIQQFMIGKATHVKQCPAPTPGFTGQEDKVAQVEACISRGDVERCVFVIHGMGGAGKTQIALKTIERTHAMWTDIVYVDATSLETAISALEEFATAKGVGNTYQDTIVWLGSRRERWLMVFDNADDPSLDIGSLMPRGDHGSILITTRMADMALLARGLRSACNVSSMEPVEALELLLKTARIEDESMADGEREEAIKLVQDFGHLALAVVHAGAYIWRSHLTIRKYREMFAKQHKATLDRYSETLVKVDDYKKSVYTTWCMSYERLSDRAKELMWLMAFMHNNNITEDIFRRAAVNIQSYQLAIRPSEEECNIQTHIARWLLSYLDSAGSWDSGAFLSGITELVSYSLASHDDANGVYNMHVLVHDWARTVIPGPKVAAVKRTMFLLVLSIKSDDTARELAYQRALELHVNSVLGHGVQCSANDACSFTQVYDCTGRWSRKEVLDLMIVANLKDAFGEELPYILAMGNLASTYSSQGRYKEAEVLRVEVLDACKRILGDEHPDTLGSIINLASTYSDLGRHKEAEALQVDVLDACKRVLGDEHPHTLKSMNNLALTYSNQSRHKEAEVLQVEVLNARKRLFGDEHPDTLMSMNRLALTYLNQGRHKEAEELQVGVLGACKRLLGDEHPDTLGSMSSLASTYSNQDRHEEAEALQVEVLNARKRLLGDEHPDTLMSMGNLTSIYLKHGRYKEAEELQVELLNACKRVLGNEHPHTLATMNNLALAYLNQGRYKEAEVLQVEALNAYKRVLGDEHPDTLASMDNLALTFSKQGRDKEAEELQVGVLNGYKRLLGDEHPNTLESMNYLASTYLKQGRQNEAEALQAMVLDARKRLIGDEHPPTLMSTNDLASTSSNQA